jgi:hypothetical protein
MTTTYPLVLEHGHLFALIDGHRWVVDTGSPASLGQVAALQIGHRAFAIKSALMGLDAETLSGLIGQPVAGLLGNDILNAFDGVMDVQAGVLTLAEALPAAPDGVALPLTFMMEVPQVAVRVAGAVHSLILDTGAQLSYFQDDSLADYPPMGVLADFYPGLGRFETPTHCVPMELGPLSLALRCGSLPAMLGLGLSLLGVTGILGNDLLRHNRLIYLPRQEKMVLQPNAV